MDDTFFHKIGTQVAAHPRRKRDQSAFDEEGQPEDEAPPRPSRELVARRWSQSDDTFWPAAETCDRLQAGFYRFNSLPNIGPCLVRTKIATDNLLELPDTASAEVLEEFARFWQLKPRFSARGFLHKRGFLLWGPPGAGKSCSLMLMAHRIVQQDGLVCQIEHPRLAATCLGFVRKIEPERPILAILEDLDALIDRHGETEFLALLDGETQIDSIIYVATTNYPERLDKRFVDRPSRFDTIRWIGMPSAAARKMYLMAKEPSLCDAELVEWVRRTEGFSIAHLRELIILVQCFGRSLDAAVAQLEDMHERQPNSGDAPDRPSFGIVASRG